MNNRLVILSDNRTNDARLETEHGLSIYMEGPSGKFLLDTGASDLFVRNAALLDIDLSDIDYCLISHGHSDHIGGLNAFLTINSKAKVILSAQIPGAEYVSVRRYPHSITSHVDFDRYHDRFVFVDNNTMVGPVQVYAHIMQHHALPLGDKNLLIRTSDDSLTADAFHHELVFLVDGVLFTGCAHNGLLNILETVKQPFDVAIGGFHLLDSHLDQHYETDMQLQAISASLRETYSNVTFYTGHCTGDHCFDMLSDQNDRLHQFHGGDTITW